MRRQEENELVRWVAERKEPGTRQRGRPKERPRAATRGDGKAVGLSKADDKIEWRMVSRRPITLYSSVLNN